MVMLLICLVSYASKYDDIEHRSNYAMVLVYIVMKVLIWYWHVGHLINLKYFIHFQIGTDICNMFIHNIDMTLIYILFMNNSTGIVLNNRYLCSCK